MQTTRVADGVQLCRQAAHSLSETCGLNLTVSATCADPCEFCHPKGGRDRIASTLGCGYGLNTLPA